MKRKILFVVEALTFAHVARSAVLAKALKNSGYEMHFACYPHAYLGLVKSELEGCKQWPLKTRVDYPDYVDRMSKAKSPYDVNTIDSYVKEELALFEQIVPDLVIGDLRYSLSISCPQARLHYVNLVNAVWSPFTRQELTYPEGWLTPMLGSGLRNWLFELLYPLGAKNICRPFNQFRSQLGLPLFRDVFDLNCGGDTNLYLDSPELFEVHPLPNNHLFIGPVLHSLESSFPPSLESLDKALPTIFISLGSSGSIETLPLILRSLTRLPVNIVVATSGRKCSAVPAGKNIFVYDFLPALEILKISSLVVSNGGSPMSYLALSQGVPVVAVCSNMDQHLTSQALQRAGAGVALRSEILDEEQLRRSVQDCLDNPGYRERAQSCSASISAEKTAQNFLDAIHGVVSGMDQNRAIGTMSTTNTKIGEVHAY